MNKKRLDTSAIRNELEGSAFFRSPQAAPPAPATTTQARLKPTALPEQTPAQDERTIVPSNVRTNERIATRQQVRHSFDVFADQLLSLRSIALAREGTFGKRVLLGDLVQQALDMFITKERNTE